MRRFHAAHPGITGRALARAGSYARLAALVPRDARVLDLACGDGVLLAQLGPRAVGLDLSREELGPLRRVVQGRAQALPFAAASFDAVTCHLAFMLFDDLEQVVAELARVLAPGGAFFALLGGGPTAHGDDAFHRFLALLAPYARAPVRLGDPRARSEAGWEALFAGWGPVTFERWELDLGGSFEEVWAFVGASYEVPAVAARALHDQLAAATRDLTDAAGRIPCTAVTWLARVNRPA